VDAAHGACASADYDAFGECRRLQSRLPAFGFQSGLYDPQGLYNSGREVAAPGPLGAEGPDPAGGGLNSTPSAATIPVNFVDPLVRAESSQLC
jgi:hypothetical protein